MTALVRSTEKVIFEQKLTINITTTIIPQNSSFYNKTSSHQTSEKNTRFGLEHRIVFASRSTWMVSPLGFSAHSSANSTEGIKKGKEGTEGGSDLMVLGSTPAALMTAAIFVQTNCILIPCAGSRLKHQWQAGGGGGQIAGENIFVRGLSGKRQIAQDLALK